MIKRTPIVLITFLFIMFMATVVWAGNVVIAPIDPNSGPSGPGPNTHIDNSMMAPPTSTPATPKPAVLDKITIIVNGKVVKSDVEPYITEGRTMVPYRFVAEALGCKVEWVGEQNRVVAVKGDKIVQMEIGLKRVIINKVGRNIDVAPVLKNSRTFVPVRFMSEALGYDVRWDGNTGTVYINE